MQARGRTWALLEDTSDLCMCWPCHDGYRACPCGPALLVQVPLWMLRSVSSLQCPVSCSLPPGHRTCSPRSAPPQDMRLCSAGCSGENRQLSRPFPSPARPSAHPVLPRLLPTRPCPPWHHSHSVCPAHHQKACPELKPLPSCSPSQDFLPPKKTTMFTWTVSRCDLLCAPRCPTPSAPLSLCTQHHCPTACGWHGQLPLPPSPPGSLISFT